VNPVVEDLLQAKMCGYHGHLETAKELLDAKGWLIDVNEHFAGHGLVSDLVVYWVYNGQSASPAG